MSIKRPQSLPIRSIPDIHHRILRSGKEEIALCIEDDLGEGSFVSLEDDWFLPSVQHPRLGITDAPGSANRVPFLAVVWWCDEG